MEEEERPHGNDGLAAAFAEAAAAVEGRCRPPLLGGSQSEAESMIYAGRPTAQLAVCTCTRTELTGARTHALATVS